MEFITVLLSPERLLKMYNRKDPFQSMQSIDVVLFPAELAPAGGESELRGAVPAPSEADCCPIPHAWPGQFKLQAVKYERQFLLC